MKNLFMVLALVILVSCGGNKSKETAATKGNAVVVEQVVKPLVTLEQVFVQDVPQVTEMTATAQANVTNKIAPQMSVRINKLLVEVGDNVKVGQKLAQMDNNALEQAKTQLNNLELTFKRLDELYKVGGVSKAEWDAQKTALDVARKAMENLSENVYLVSPINGVVTARNYDNGDLYAMAAPVYVIEQMTPIKLKVNISETDYTKIHLGMNVDVRLDVFKDEIFQGKISLIYPSISAATRTFPVEITIPNTDKKIRSGMFARVTINLGTESRVVVPDRAVIRQSGSNERFVYVYDNGKVLYKKVELGQRFENNYEILSGLEDGEQVVVTGHTRLTDGMEVELAK